MNGGTAKHVEKGHDYAANDRADTRQRADTELPYFSVLTHLWQPITCVQVVPHTQPRLLYDTARTHSSWHSTV